MSCTTLISPSLALWLGALAIGLGAVLLAGSRGLTLDELGAFGLKLKLQEPIRLSATQRLRAVGIVVVVLAVLLLGYGGLRTAVPLRTPTSIADVCTADIQISRVDDSMEVKINDRSVARAAYGETPGWVDIKPLLRSGSNKVEILVDNGQYGGCGGLLVGRINGAEIAALRWERQKTENQPPNSACFYETLTLNLTQ